MLKNISIFSTNFLIQKKPLLAQKRNIYTYGFEIIYSTLFCTLSILLLGTIQDRLLQTFIFLSVFSVGRVLAGGYHASTYKKCYLLTLATFLAAQLLMDILIKHHFFQYPLFMFSILYLLIKGPIYSAEKKIKPEAYHTHRKRLIIFLAALSIITPIYWIKTSYLISAGISSTIFFVTILFFIKERGRKL